MSTTPFAAPSSAAGITWADLNGALLIIDVKSVETGIRTLHGDSDAVRADVTVIDGTQTGTVYTDTLVFPKVLQSQLRGNVGQKVLGRLGQGQAKPGQSAPWLLSEATADDTKTAMDWLNRNSLSTPAQAQPPF